MAILKLYGAAQATCTRRVGTVLHEAKVPFELVEVDIRGGEHKTPAYLAKQPFGQIPYIVRRSIYRIYSSAHEVLNNPAQDDDGFILYETRAICRYIAASYPVSKLIPTDSRRNALFERAASVESANFEPSASTLVWETRQKPWVSPFISDSPLDRSSLNYLQLGAWV